MKVQKDNEIFNAFRFDGDLAALREWADSKIPDIDAFVVKVADTYGTGWKLEQLAPIWIVLEYSNIYLYLKELPKEYKLL